MNRACPECGHRQDGGDRCANCGYDGIVDLGNMRHVDLLRDIDRRRLDRHHDRARKLSVAIAMGAIFACWFIPGFWAMRRQAFALPLLLDQWLLMFALALGISKIFDRYPPNKRFPFIED